MDPDFISAVETINRGILGHNAKSLGVIKSLSNHISVPASDDRHRPLMAKEDLSGTNRVTVPVFTHYIVGDHEWFYHLPGPEFDRIRVSVIEELGLANPPGPFPHSPEGSPQLLEIYKVHKVWARHGDIFDGDNGST